jgi:hypothetical protein
MAAGKLSCLARNGRSPGEESLAAAIAVQAIEAQPAFGQIKPMRGQVLACAEQHLGDVPANDRLKQEAPSADEITRLNRSATEDCDIAISNMALISA